MSAKVSYISNYSGSGATCSVILSDGGLSLMTLSISSAFVDNTWRLYFIIVGSLTFLFYLGELGMTISSACLTG